MTGMILGGVTYSRLVSVSGVGDVLAQGKPGPSFYLALSTIFITAFVIYALQQAHWCEVLAQQLQAVSRIVSNPLNAASGPAKGSALTTAEPASASPSHQSLLATLSCRHIMKMLYTCQTKTWVVQYFLGAELMLLVCAS